MNIPLTWWVATVAVILTMLAIDLFVFHREAHRVDAKEAGIWTAVWVTLGLGFAGFIAWGFGAEFAGEYLAGYVIEKSLAVDNIFVFAVIFAAFGIPDRYQHRVLFWGVIGALVLRGAFIAAGAALLKNFHWTIYAFGALLLVTAWRMWQQRDHSTDPADNAIVRGLKKRLPMTDGLDGERFLVRRAGRTMVTPLLAALIAIEIADVVFAVDSIPAIFAVTEEPFLVFTSNAFAILGLRSMYFYLADMLHRFQHLSTGLVGVLAFVGLKMMLIDVVKIPIAASLGVIVVILGLSIISSIRSTSPHTHAESDDSSTPDDDTQVISSR